jgi:hypothetical protein
MHDTTDDTLRLDDLARQCKDCGQPFQLTVDEPSDMRPVLTSRIQSPSRYTCNATRRPSDETDAVRNSLPAIGVSYDRRLPETVSSTHRFVSCE